MVSIDKTLKILALALGLGFLVYLGRAFLIPFAFAFIISLFTYPFYKWFHKIVKSNILAVLLSFIILILPVTLIILIIYDQLLQIISTMPDIRNKLFDGLSRVWESLSNFLNLDLNDLEALTTQLTGDLSRPLNFLSTGINSTTNFLFGFLLCLIFIFFLLYYSRPFTNYFISQFRPAFRDDVEEILFSIRDMVKSYVGGLGIVIVLLAVLNTLGLWIIGVDYAVFWGILAGCLAIIPYLGTFMAGLLPFLYSLATYDHTWQPIAIVLYYTAIQQIEGNFITPKILGQKVNINPFFALLSIIVAGSVFGMAGIILAIPIISIIRIIFSHFDPLKPTATILGTGLSNSADKFIHEYNEEKYSLLSIFRDSKLPPPSSAADPKESEKPTDQN